MYQIRDPIHGFIEVSELELKIIDSLPFQRLRNIKQLATTYLVYPGAVHTRFEHSLGVLHLVTLAFNNALKNYKNKKGKELFNDTKKKWYIQILRLIALTHDLGHAPFSHGSEALFDGGVEHEDFTKKIICETEIANYIDNIGDDFCSRYGVGAEFKITSELLWLIYGQKNPEMDDRYVMPDYKFLKSFMDSELDCDKMDYLLRDSYYCGVTYGKYDLHRLLSSLTVYKKEKDNILQLAVESGGTHVFEEFVIARYFMFIQVYFHKTRRYLDRLLVKVIESLLENGKYPEDVNDYETKSHCNQYTDSDLFMVVKKDLKAKLECDVIEDTATKLTHKIPILELYNADSGKGIPIIVDYMDKPKNIADESILLQSLIHPINIKRIYVDKNKSCDARRIIAESFNDEEEEQ